jgi:DNA ligase (NAD+)
MPERCPVCDSPVVRAEGEARHYCSNRSCPSRGYEGLKHFVSRGAMDIDGVGEKLVARLLELGLVTRPQDLYRLTADDLLPLEGFQQRSAENVIASIDASRQRPFGNVLFALGIPHVGYVNAQLLADEFGSVDALAQASAEQIAAAEASTADYYAVGPVWETPTKPGRPAVGLDLVRHAAERASKPWFAIGGIDAGNAPDVVAAGATRLAVVRAIRDAADPRAAAAELRAAIGAGGDGAPGRAAGDGAGVG